MLNILALDTLPHTENSVGAFLSEAKTNGTLPIGMLSVHVDFAQLLAKKNIRYDAYQVFIAAFDRVKPEHIRFFQTLRQEQERMFIVFALARAADIQACVSPSLQTSAVWFIPVDKRHVHETITEIDAAYRRRTAEEPSLRIKTGGEVFSLNPAQICFFEARAKKMAVKTTGQEIEFYSNFDKLMESLPPCFVRCHRGFMVNIRRITHVSFTDMEVRLDDNSVIPVSRSYKDTFKARLAEEGISL